MPKLRFISYEFPKTVDGQYTLLQLDHQILQSRREQLGLSQQQVADMAHIQLRQYQRLESAGHYLSGCSMRIGLSVCAALYLDPYEFMGQDIRQPDVLVMRPQYVSDADIPAVLRETALTKKHVGRKPTKKETLKVYLDCRKHMLILPPNVLGALRSPAYLQLLYHGGKNCLALRAAGKRSEQAVAVPAAAYEGAHLALSVADFSRTLQPDARQADTLAVDAQLVRDDDGRLGLLIDPAAAVPAELPSGLIEYI